MQHKSLPAEFKVHAEKREIEGYAATFGNSPAKFGPHLQWATSTSPCLVINLHP